VPWQVEHEMFSPLTCLSCLPVLGGIAWHEPQVGAGGVQDWVDAGGVPVQPDGEAVTVRVCVPLAEQALHAPVVYVQATGGGVQDCERTGVPAQPAGEDAVTVRVCVPLAEQAPQAE
jgi:hypothetical protein